MLLYTIYATVFRRENVKLFVYIKFCIRQHIRRTLSRSTLPNVVVRISCTHDFRTFRCFPTKLFIKEDLQKVQHCSPSVTGYYAAR